MSVRNEIDRIKANVTASLNEINIKGITVPSTATSDNLPALIRQIPVGDATYVTGRKVTVVLPVSGWGKSGNVYAQTVTANVTANSKGLAQILLSSDLYTSISELEADENLSSVKLQNGSVLVEIKELPEVPLTMEISIINGLAASNKAALMCLDSKAIVFTLNSDAWMQSGNVYTQTVAVDGVSCGIVFGDVLFDDDSNVAEEQLFEAENVAKFEVSDGSITASCYGYPPEIDLQYFIKVFNEE